MKKSLLLLVTLFTALFAGAETIDNTTATWTAAADGITFTSGTYTLTASKAAGKTAPQQHAQYKDVRVYAKSTLTIATTGSNMKSIVFKIAKSGIYRQADMSASTGTVQVDTTAMTVTWTGDANNVVLTVGEKATYGREKNKNGQFRFIKTEINETAGGGGETGETPTVTEMNIVDLNALTADKANVRLKFTNAKVLGSHTSKQNAKSIYVREGGKAVILYNTGLELSDNAILNGYVDIDFKLFNGIPEVVKNNQTNATNLTVTESSEEAVPVETTIAELNAKKHLADLVVLRGVTIKSEKSGQYTNYYAVSGSDRIQLFGGIKVKDYVNGKSYDVVAIFNQIYKGITPEIAPTKVTEANSTGISTIQEAQKVVVYDIQGRRVQKAEKGLFIINGKKVLVK